MGRSKKPSGPNANLEPLGGSRANFADEKSNPIHVEQDTKDLSLSPFRTSTHQSTRAARPRPRSPQYASHYNPRSTRLHRPRHRSRSPPRQRSRSGSPRISTSRSYRSRSPHRISPRHRGVANRDHYRPSYAARTPRKSSEYRYRAPSVVSAHNPGESLDDKETPVTESWAELASRKHREWTAPAPGSPTSPTLPDPVEESWVEMASRKYKELKVVETSKANDWAEITPITPTKPRDARLIKERERLRGMEGLDIQSQVSSLIYARKVKAGASAPLKKVGATMEARKKDIPSSPSVKVSPQHSSIHSKESTSVLEQDRHRPKRSLLGSFPIQDFADNSHIPAEPHQPISPPKVRINKETLISRIQELRRASSASEKPRPIRNIMDESFDDYDFDSEHIDVEPVVPTHWQD
ncbi:hypothetical protein MFRU_008g01040 [Monilinia fructicola]|nr:hypothetical protein MFRU_008g01040 [Monilinia fructicola]